MLATVAIFVSLLHLQNYYKQKKKQNKKTYNFYHIEVAILLQLRSLLANDLIEGHFTCICKTRFYVINLIGATTILVM